MDSKDQTNQNRTNKDLCNVRMIHFERIAYAKQQAIPVKELDHIVNMYKMLGDPTRLKMLMALRDNEMCVCDLAAFTGLTESAVSHQLRRLRDTALVKKRREGQVLYYSLDDKHVDELLEIALAHVCE